MNKYLLFFLLVISTHSFACSCTIPSIKKSFYNSDAIFVGKVVSVDSTKYDFNSNIVFAFTFEIKEEFKKQRFTENKKYYTTIYTPQSSMYGGCGSYFKLNETYLVYGYKTRIGTATNTCTRTNELNSINNTELDSLKKLQVDFLKMNESEIDLEYLLEEDDFKSLLEIENLNNTIKRLESKEKYYISIIICTVFILIIMFFYILIKHKKSILLKRGSKIKK